MSAIRVLLVDDQELVRDGFATILDLQDDIEVVGSVADGVAVASTNCPGVADLLQATSSSAASPEQNCLRPARPSPTTARRATPSAPVSLPPRARIRILPTPIIPALAIPRS